MKQEEFERLKTVLKNEGYVLSQGGVIPGSSILVEIYKNDVLDEVEYCRWMQSDSEFFIKGKIYRFFNQFDHTYLETGRQHFTNEVWVKSNFLPSTESAYIEQLKKEAHERFGDIKEGVVIDNSMINSDYPKESKIYGNNFYYEKEEDRLLVGSKDIRTCIYQQGKWATQAKERVEVEPISAQFFHIDNTVQFKFKTINMNGLKGNITEFLAYQLEKYLNGEIGKENSNV